MKTEMQTGVAGRRARTLRCARCGGREFLVFVEPGRGGLEPMELELRWIKQAVRCPVCGQICEVV